MNFKMGEKITFKDLVEVSKLIDLMNIKKPIVHCITNFVTTNDCANVLLSINTSPIMTNSINEVEEVTSFSNSLLLNIGTLNSKQVESMILAGKKAKDLNIPIIFDPVGSGSTKYRSETSNLILEKIRPDIIRGNISEIKSLINKDNDITNARGVDASFDDIINIENINNLSNEFISLSLKYDSIIVATGEIDIIVYKNKVYYCSNGNEKLCKITGSGCMLSSIIAGYAGLFSGNDKNNLLQSSIIGTLIMNISGELASSSCFKENNFYLGNFHSELINQISCINKDIILKMGNVYEKKH